MPPKQRKIPPVDVPCTFHFSSEDPLCCNTSFEAFYMAHDFPQVWKTWQEGVERTELYQRLLAILAGTYTGKLPGPVTHEIEDVITKCLPALQKCLRRVCHCAEEYWRMAHESLDPLAKALGTTRAWRVTTRLSTAQRVEQVLVPEKLDLDIFTKQEKIGRRLPHGRQLTLDVTYDGTTLTWHETYASGVERTVAAVAFNELETEALEYVEEHNYDARESAVALVAAFTAPELALAYRWCQSHFEEYESEEYADVEDRLDLSNVALEFKKAGVNRLDPDELAVALSLATDWTQTKARLVRAAKLTLGQASAA